MADGNLFDIEVVTPERILLDGAASEVILRTGEGDTTFLAGHAPLIGTVEAGVVRVVRAEGEEERVAAHGGFVQVEQHVPSSDGSEPAGSGTRVTMLIGVAERAEEIDSGRARSALESAEARAAELAGAGARSAPSGATSPDEAEPDAALLEVESARRRAEVRLAAADPSAGPTA